MADFSEIEKLMQEIAEEAEAAKQVFEAKEDEEDEEEANKEEEAPAEDNKMIHISDQANWHAHTMNAFKEFWEDKSCMDFKIFIGEKEIGAHRLVLNLFSHFFRDYFHAPETKGIQTINLDHLNYGAVYSVLTVIYTGEMQIYPETMKDIFKVVREFRLTDSRVLEQVELYIEEHAGDVVKNTNGPKAVSRKM